MGRSSTLIAALLFLGPAASFGASSEVPGTGKPVTIPRIETGIAAAGEIRLPPSVVAPRLPTTLQQNPSAPPAVRLDDAKAPAQVPAAQDHAPLRETLSGVGRTLQNTARLEAGSDIEAREAGLRLEKAVAGGAQSDSPSVPAPEPASSLLDDFARNFTLGKFWEPRQAVTPELEPHYRALKEKSEALNRDFAETTGRSHQLIAGLAHDFNNGLSVVKGWATMLEMFESKSTSEERRKSYGQIQSAAASLARTTANFLALAKLQAGKLKVDPKQTDVGAIFSQAAKDLEHQAREKRIILAVELPGTPLSVTADPQAMSIVAVNLIGNAIKYTPEGGRVTIGLALDPSKPGLVTVYVQDTGIGISPEDQAKVFGGYYRTEAGQAMAKGFGIGLPLVKHLVEASGSALDLQSEPGKGSRFSFDLPLW